MRQFEKLVKLSENKNGLTLNTAIRELLQTGITRTGSSGYSGGWRRKSVWTQQVSTFLSNHKISHEVGNDAPRGGASGEYVRLTGNVLKEVLKKKAERQQRRLEERRRQEAERQEQEERYKKYCDETYKAATEQGIAINFLDFPDNYWVISPKDTNGRFTKGWKLKPSAFHELAAVHKMYNNQGWRRYVIEKINEQIKINL